MAWLDESLVFLALVISLAYAGFTLAPRDLRRKIAQRLKSAAPRSPRALGLRRGMTWLAVAAEAKVPGGCGGCEDCGPKTAAARSAEGPATPPAPEIRVPLSQIGHRRGPRAG